MDTALYLDNFKKCTDSFDTHPFEQHSLQIKTGVWLNSVVLKIQKPDWVNPAALPLAFNTSVFFSVWISDDAIRESKLYYNIHALKLRELTDYKFKSREFAHAFRKRFKPFEKDWPNVSFNYGPLTLMEGWVNIDLANYDDELNHLAHQFLNIQHIIDELFAQARKQ